jgi:hypothetical protein
MRDPTAQTEPLTAGQQIVAAWETDIIAEPCELAECIDQRIAAAVKAEREACAKMAQDYYSFVFSEEGDGAKSDLAEAMRNRS